MADQFKRNTAYKLKIGNILSGKTILENEKLKALELGDKSIVRVNVIANVVDKYSQEGEKYLVDVFKSSTKYHKNIYLSPENWTGGYWELESF